MDYNKLSDFEINEAVSMAMLDKAANPNAKYIAINDYCNDPADAWPIISANRITIEFDAEHQCDVPVEWVTAYGIDGLKVHLVAHQPCDKALRSAMIVFLMMQESANVPANSTRSDIR